MGESNVDLARRGYEAFARGDMDAVFALVASDAVFEDAPALPDAGVWQGHEGMVAGLAAEREHQEEVRLDPIRYVESGDQVCVLIEQHARGRFSGIDMSRRIAHVWRFEGGKAVAMRTFSNWEEGLAAVGGD